VAGPVFDSLLLSHLEGYRKKNKKGYHCHARIAGCRLQAACFYGKKLLTLGSGLTPGSNLMLFCGNRVHAVLPRQLSN